MRFRVINTSISALLVLCSTLTYASGDSTGGLAAELKQHYRLATAKLRVNGVVSIEPGTILLVQKEGIVSFEQKDSSFAPLCPTEYREGELHADQTLSCTSLTAGSRRVLKLAEPVCVTAIEVSESHDTVTLFLATCDRVRPQSSTYRSLVVFHFPAGSLARTAPSRVENVISEVLSEKVDGAEGMSQATVEAPATPVAEPDATTVSEAPEPTPEGPKPTGTKPLETKPAEPEKGVPQPAVRPGGANAAEPHPNGSSADAETPAAQPGAGADTPAPAPVQVAKGQDPDQVRAIEGPPSAVADLGSRVIYFYPHLKVVFINGKATQIEQI